MAQDVALRHSEAVSEGDRDGVAMPVAVSTSEGVAGAVLEGRGEALCEGEPVMLLPPVGVAGEVGEGEAQGEAEGVGLSEAVADTEGVVPLLRVALAHSESVAQGLDERVTGAVPDEAPLPDPKGEPVPRGALGVALPVPLPPQGEREAEAQGVALGLPQVVLLGLTEGDVRGEGVPLLLPVAQTLALLLRREEPLQEAEAVPAAVAEAHALLLPPLAQAVAVPPFPPPLGEAESLALTAPDTLAEPLLSRLTVPQDVPLRVGEAEALGQGETLALVVAEGAELADREAEPELLPVGTGAVALRGAEGDPWGDREALPQTLLLPLAGGEGVVRPSVEVMVAEAVGMSSVPEGEEVREAQLGVGAALAELQGLAAKELELAPEGEAELLEKELGVSALLLLALGEAVSAPAPPLPDTVAVARCEGTADTLAAALLDTTSVPVGRVVTVLDGASDADAALLTVAALPEAERVGWLAVAWAEPLDRKDAAEEGEEVSEGSKLEVGAPLPLPPQLGDAVPVPAALPLTLGEAEVLAGALRVPPARLALPDAQLLGSGVAHGEGVAETEPLALREAMLIVGRAVEVMAELRDAQALALALGVAKVADALREGEREGRGEREGCAERELEAVAEAAPLLVPLRGGERVVEGQALLERVRPTDGEAEGQPVPLTETPAEALTKALPVNDAEADGQEDGVPDAAPLGEAREEGEAAEELLWLPLGEALVLLWPLRVLQPVGVVVGRTEREAEGQLVALALLRALGDRDGEGVPVGERRALAQAEGLPLPAPLSEALPLGEPLRDVLLLGLGEREGRVLPLKEALGVELAL